MWSAVRQSNAKSTSKSELNDFLTADNGIIEHKVTEWEMHYAVASPSSRRMLIKDLSSNKLQRKMSNSNFEDGSLPRSEKSVQYLISRQCNWDSNWKLKFPPSVQVCRRENLATTQWNRYWCNESVAVIVQSRQLTKRPQFPSVLIANVAHMDMFEKHIFQKTFAEITHKKPAWVNCKKVCQHLLLSFRRIWPIFCNADETHFCQ